MKKAIGFVYHSSLGMGTLQWFRSQIHNVGLEAMSERKLFEIVVEYVEASFVAKCMMKSVRTNLDCKSNNKSTTCDLSLD